MFTCGCSVQKQFFGEIFYSRELLVHYIHYVSEECLPSVCSTSVFQLKLTNKVPLKQYGRTFDSQIKFSLFFSSFPTSRSALTFALLQFTPIFPCVLICVVRLSQS